MMIMDFNATKEEKIKRRKKYDESKGKFMKKYNELSSKEKEFEPYLFSDEVYINYSNDYRHLSFVESVGDKLIWADRGTQY